MCRHVTMRGWTGLDLELNSGGGEIPERGYQLCLFFVNKNCIHGICFLGLYTQELVLV